MEDSVPCWIDGSVRPVLLIVDPDRFLIDRNAIRVLTVSRLWLGFLYPVANSDTTSTSAQLLKKNNCI